MAAPSYQAVAKLRDFNWALLSNGPLWRIYCKKSPSESTSFFELNLEGLSDASDSRLVYLAAIFSALSFVRKGGISDIDLIYEGSIIIGYGLEEDLRRVKRWRDSEHFQRWLATAALSNEKRMHRVKGFAGLKLLSAAISKLCSKPVIDFNRKAA